MALERFAFVTGGQGTGTVDRVRLSDGTITKLVSDGRAFFGNKKLIVMGLDLSIVNPVTMTTEATLSVSKEGLGVIGSNLYAQGGLPLPGDLVEVSLVSNTVTNTFAVPGRLNRNLPYAFGSLWSHNSFPARTFGIMRIYRVNPSNGTIEADISTGNTSSNQVYMLDIAATNDAVYASDLQERIYKIDPDTDTITDTFDVRSELSITNPANVSAKALTSDGDSVFFITGVGGLYKIDSSDNFTTFNASAGNGGVYYYDDRVYVSGPKFPNKTLLTAYDSSTGAEVLSYEWAGGEGGADVVVADVEGTFGIFVGAVVF